MIRSRGWRAVAAIVALAAPAGLVAGCGGSGLAAHTTTTAAATTNNPPPSGTDTNANPPQTPSDPSSAASGAALAAQAQAALEKGQTGNAIALAKRACDRDPKNAESWLILGAAQETAGNHGAARAAYTSCAKRAEGVRVSECRALLDQ